MFVALKMSNSEMCGNMRQKKLQKEHLSVVLRVRYTDDGQMMAFQ